MLGIKSMSISKIALKWMPQNKFDDTNIGSAIGLVQSGNNPLIEPILTKICVPRPQWVNMLRLEQNGQLL